MHLDEMRSHVLLFMSFQLERLAAHGHFTSEGPLREMFAEVGGQVAHRLVILVAFDPVYANEGTDFTIFVLSEQMR